MTVQTKESLTASPPRLLPWISVGVIAFVAVRLWFNATHALVPDEAVYWTWSRHLALGYLDHPPMVAFLIHLSTSIFGSTELGVRMPAVVLAAGSAIVLIGLGRMISDDWRVTAFIAVLWLTSPLLVTMGTIMTPDTPMYFFSACGLFCAVAAVRGEGHAARTRPSPQPSPGGPGEGDMAKWWWLGFGLFCGLAMLSKYPAVLLPASVGLALLFNREGRVHLRRPWIYLAGVIAVAVFSPDLWWNAHHGWASFKFQLHHGGESADHPGLSGLVEFAGGQLAVWTPVLFVIGVVVLVHFWRRAIGRGEGSAKSNLKFQISNFKSEISNFKSEVTNFKSEISNLKSQISNRKDPHPGPLPEYRERGEAECCQGGEGQHREGRSAWLWILLWAGTVPLVFFGIMATRAHGEVNWPAFAYAPISILTALYLAENWHGDRIQWARIGCTVAIVGAIFMHFPRLLFWMHIRPSAMVQMYETKPFGQMLDRMADGRTIVCNRHQNAAVASFYMKGQPDIWAVSFGSRPTAYDYLPGRPDFAAMSRVLFVGYHFEPFCQAYGFRVERQEQVPLPSIRKKKRTAMLVSLDRLPNRSRNIAAAHEAP